MKFDKRSFLREGRNAVYKGKEYCLSSKFPEHGMVRLLSYDKKDLENGFCCDKSKEYMEEHGFRCHKYVPKSEITEAYKIEFTAKYKGKTYNHVDGYAGDDYENKENIVTIHTIVSTYSEPDEYDYCKANGFIDGVHEGYSLISMYKYVNINDPELEIIETRTELDIDEL